MAESVTEAWYSMMDKEIDNPRRLFGKLIGYHNAEGHRFIAGQLGVAPRSVDRWFQWFTASGKQQRDPTRNKDEWPDRAEGLARLVPIIGGSFAGTIRKSKDTRYRSLSLPDPKKAPKGSYTALHTALLAGDEEGAQQAFWDVYNLEPDEIEDDADYELYA